MKKLKIGLIDADLIDNGTRHPNLALMKLSGYHKNVKNSVELLLDYSKIDKYDQVYISKVFTFTKIPNLSKYKNIIYGGTGFFKDGGKDLDGGFDLQGPIEHHMPDYSLYNEYIELQLMKGKKKNYFKDYLDYSIGFTTRGCFRKCEFCVNQKYTKVIKHSPINEFLDTSRKSIYLWDDNFLAYSNWEEILDELEKTKKSFQFRQGLDIRLMTEKKAERLSKVSYKGDYIFAFDFLKDKEIIENGLKIWRKYTHKTTKLYVLVAYESQDLKDIKNAFERIKILMKYGTLPYIMRYEEYKNSEFRNMYIQLARWCNQPRFFKKTSFREFCELNQKYHKNKNSFCSTYKVLLYFEKNYPELVKEYFDLKYENLNVYGRLSNVEK